jgi:dihydropyrimidinase
MDLCIRNGTIVTATSTVTADVGVVDGRIVQIGGRLPPAAREIDARSLLVMPGAIDVHTHFDMPFMGMTTADDFDSGTRAAAAGGVTTVLDFAVQSPTATLAATLATWHEKARERSLIDYGFHLAITRWDEGTADEVAAAVEAGVTSFKAFMAYRGSLMLDDGAILQLLQTTRSLGALVMVHAEHGDVVATLQRQALARGEVGPRSHAATRPPLVEIEATRRIITLAEIAGAPLYVVHVSCAGAAEAVTEARRRGLPVYAETCPQYLGAVGVEAYDLPGFEAAGFVCSPPLRERSEADALWAALATGALQIVSSDHSPFTPAQKRLGEGDFTRIPNGVPGVETRVPLVWTLGVASGRISPNRFVDLVATEPARRFGLTTKGDVAIGLDADLMLFDPRREVVLSARALHQRSDTTPYEGFACQGYPVMTVSRGDVVWDGSGFHGAAGRGRFLARRGGGAGLS